jgi:RNA ligase
MTSRIKLKNIFDTSRLQYLIDHNFVNCREHPEYPNLKILSYSTRCQITGMWDEVTINCRGVIVDKPEGVNWSDALVIARPFRKFFSISQITDEGDWGKVKLIDDVDWDEKNIEKQSYEIEEVEIDFKGQKGSWSINDKLDGSLIIAFVNPYTGKVEFASKGSFNSEQAELADELMKGHPICKDIGRRDDYTYLFELIGPDNQIVLEYPKNELRIIARIHNKDGFVTPYTSMVSGINSPKLFCYTSLFDALGNLDRPNAEGFVAIYTPTRGDGQLMVKIKQEDYLELHKIVNNLTPKKIFDKFSRNFDVSKTLTNDDFMHFMNSMHKELPSRAHPILDETVEQIRSLVNFETAEIDRLWSKVLEHFGLVEGEEYKLNLHPKSAVARVINDIAGKDWSGYLFRIRDGKLYNDLLFKNIRRDLG